MSDNGERLHSAMIPFTTTRDIIGDVLQLGDRTDRLTPDTALLGSLPEFDSMAVVALITAIEERLDIAVDDDEISADVFTTAGSVHAFVEQKLAS